MNLTKVGLAIVGLSIIPQVLSLDHLGHEPDQGGAGHSQSDLLKMLAKAQVFKV